MEDDVLLDFEVEKRKVSYLFRYKNDVAFECGVVDMFNTNIAVHYVIFLLKDPPYFVYAFIEFYKYEGSKIYQTRKEFLADRIFDSRFNEILDQIMKVKKINEFRNFFRRLVIEK